jgi:hypothetical protein
MDAVAATWPAAVVQFEDFSNNHCFDVLARYRDRYRNFNDDAQGTGAVIAAGLEPQRREIDKEAQPHRAPHLDLRRRQRCHWCCRFHLLGDGHKLRRRDPRPAQCPRSTLSTCMVWSRPREAERSPITRYTWPAGMWPQKTTRSSLPWLLRGQYQSDGFDCSPARGQRSRRT